MKEHALIRGAILVFWTLFWGLSVVDKIVPDVQHLWVGKDFFALFVKFFASLGLKDPLFATVALAGVSGLEAVNFTLYAVAALAFFRGDGPRSEVWFFRGVFTSMGLFALFSIADQVFGDRFPIAGARAVLGHPARVVGGLQVLFLPVGTEIGFGQHAHGLGDWAALDVGHVVVHSGFFGVHLQASERAGGGG